MELVARQNEMNNKIKGFLNSGQLSNLYTSKSLQELVNEVGLPDGYTSQEELLQYIDKEHKRYGDDTILGFVYASLEIYVQAKERLITAFTVNRLYYLDRLLPQWLTDDSYKGMFDELFSYSESDLRDLMINISVEGRKKISPTSYLTIYVKTSKVSLHFCGENGQQGLCKISVDMLGEPETIIW
ncbi:MAG: hypothetical protein AAFR81_27960 [Chloroflexota bacterium]